MTSLLLPQMEELCPVVTSRLSALDFTGETGNQKEAESYKQQRVGQQASVCSTVPTDTMTFDLSLPVTYTHGQG